MSEVNHPQHYGGEDNPYEVIKVCRAWLTPTEYVGALKFQIWKYTARHRQKGGLVDLEKSQFYQNELVRFSREMEEKRKVLDNGKGTPESTEVRRASNGEGQQRTNGRSTLLDKHSEGDFLQRTDGPKLPD